MRQPKIGEIFSYEDPENRTHVVVCCKGKYQKNTPTGGNCKACAFNGDTYACDQTHCGCFHRKDKTNVVFKFVNSETHRYNQPQVGTSFDFAGTKLHVLAIPEGDTDYCRFCFGKMKDSAICKALPACCLGRRDDNIRIYPDETLFIEFIKNKTGYMTDPLLRKQQKQEKMDDLRKALKEVTDKILLENYMKPTISKEMFLEVVEHIQAQNKKDNQFADFMENYLDGRFVPTMNDHSHVAVSKLMSAAFHDLEEDQFGYTWWDWFQYECDMGAKPMSAFLDKKEYVIDSPEVFYDFMCKYLENPPQPKPEIKEDSVYDEMQYARPTAWCHLKAFINSQEPMETFGRQEILKYVRDKLREYDYGSYGDVADATIDTYLGALKYNRIIETESRGVYYKSDRTMVTGPVSRYRIIPSTHWPCEDE